MDNYRFAEVLTSIDERSHETTTVVKIKSIFAVTISQRVPFEVWRLVAYFDGDWIVMVVPRRSKMTVVQSFFETVAELIEDVEVL